MPSWPPTPRRAAVRLCLAGVIATLAVLGDARGEARAPAGETAIALVDQFVAGRLSVETAQPLDARSPEPKRSGAYWTLDYADKTLTAALLAERPDEVARSAELTLAMASGLRLQTLERKLGNWSLLHQGKNSSVLFKVRSAAGAQALVFVRLYTPSPRHDSPVASIRLRWE